MPKLKNWLQAANATPLALPMAQSWTQEAFQDVPGRPVCGPAFTVKCRAGDNLALHAALTFCQEGDVLIVSNEEDTTDPNAVKCVLPFGGAKGYGIALMIEVLCSCLSGALNGQSMGSFYDFSGKHQDSGFFVGALNAGGLTAAFETETAALFDSVKGSPRAEGVSEIFIPGEIEQRNYEKAEQEGVALSAPILKETEQLARDCGIPFDI